MAKFDIHIRSTGKVYSVPEDKTIYEVLKANGIDVPVSCKKGTCGTCMIRFIAGDVEHKDKVLSDEEHEEYLTVCCSRGTGKIILDL